MQFQHPYLLVLIAPLIASWWLLFRRRRWDREFYRFPFLLLSMIFLVLALANPYWSLERETRKLKGADLIVMMDVSQSMFCPDGAPTRIEQARIFLRSILPRFSGSPVAVIYFSGDAQIGCPLTTDVSAIHLFLDSIVPGMTVRPGTQATPLKTTLQNLVMEISGRQASRKQIGLLFSDGEFFDSDRSLRSWLSGQNEMTLFTFQGGNKETPVPKYDLSGPYPGAVSKPDPGLLKNLAEATGGRSYNLSTTNPSNVTTEMFRHVTEMIEKGKTVPRYQYYPFLLASFFCLLIYQWIPSLAGSWERMRIAKAAAIAVIFLCTIAAGKDQSDEFAKALNDLKSGRLEKGIQNLKKLQKRVSSDELEIALGNAMLQKNQPEEAIRYYRNALKLNSSNSRARWNWEIALKRQSGPQPPPPQTPPPLSAPNPLPPESQALLNYFDQLEKEDRKQENLKNANKNTFAW
jgi:Ca-activated chloride channel family protein